MTHPDTLIPHSEYAAFEKWAKPILGDNPTWRGSAQCELAWQAWRASRAALQPQATPPANTEAMRLALEALRSSQDCIQAMTDGPHHGDWGNQLDTNDAAITALEKECK